MSNEVQFDFEKEERPEYNRSDSKLVKIVIKLSGGRVDENQASYILIGFVVVTIILTFILLFSGNQKTTPTSAQQIQLNKIEQLQNSRGNIRP